MSDLRVNSIAGADGTSPATLVKQSAAKAWSGAGTTVASAGDNFNISSLVDNGTGDTTHNFTNSMSANYVTATNVRNTGTTDAHINESSSGRSNSSVRTQTMTASSGTFIDVTYAQIVVMGDFA